MEMIESYEYAAVYLICVAVIFAGASVHLFCVYWFYFVLCAVEFKR